MASRRAGRVVVLAALVVFHMALAAERGAAEEPEVVQNSLVVEVVSATGMDDTDLPFMTANPYVVVRVGNDEHKTRTLESKEPRWDQPLPVFHNVQADTPVHVKVMDEDLYFDDTMGVAKPFAASEVKGSHFIVKTIPLFKPGNDNAKAGSVNLRMLWSSQDGLREAQELEVGAEVLTGEDAADMVKDLLADTSLTAKERLHSAPVCAALRNQLRLQRMASSCWEGTCAKETSLVEMDSREWCSQVKKAMQAQTNPMGFDAWTSPDCKLVTRAHLEEVDKRPVFLRAVTSLTPRTDAELFAMCEAINTKRNEKCSRQSLARHLTCSSIVNVERRAVCDKMLTALRMAFAANVKCEEVVPKPVPRENGWPVIDPKNAPDGGVLANNLIVPLEMLVAANMRARTYGIVHSPLYDEKQQAKVIKFKKGRGLPATPVVDAATWEALFHAKRQIGGGAKFHWNNVVVDLLHFAWGDYSVRTKDNYYDSEAKLVRAFQTEHGLDVRTPGKVDQVTLKYMLTSAPNFGELTSGNVFPITAEALQCMTAAVQKETAEELATHLNKYLPEYGFKTFRSVSYFLAQAAHESWHFTRFLEGPGMCRNYDGRMGNNAEGDGCRYRGRGLLQLTGKANYRAVGRALGVDLVAHPKLVEPLEMGVRTALEYTRQRAGVWDAINAGDFRAMTYAVNGGYNGMSKRWNDLGAVRRCLHKPEDEPW